MPARLLVLALAALALGAPAAHAAVPPGDDPTGDTDTNHVHKLKPWKAKFEYRIVRESKAYEELNARSDVSALMHKDLWFHIDCQLTTTTQNGPVLWNHVPSLGWVADHNFKTYTDGRLEGSPSCAVPFPEHVWFEQGWAPTKQYRLKKRAAARTRPGGKATSRIYENRSWTTIDCAATHNGRAWVQVARQPKVGTFWLRAEVLKFWQAGLPAGLPACAVDAPPLHWVAMGDSYAAGQGANDYMTGSGDCRRSNNSYWALLQLKLKTGFQTAPSDFVACSGAKTDGVLDHQLGRLDRDTGVVTISIGGNDLGFSTVLKNCVKPRGTTCKEAIDSHFEPTDLRALESKLDGVYRAIRNRAPNAKVLVLGYPELVPRDHVDGCGAISDDDAPRLQRAATLVNNVIRGTVGKRPDFRFIGLVKTFLGHPACNDDAADWINGVVPTDSLESFHPNESGHRAIASLLTGAAPRIFG
ncbi:MAG: SGNH/GDSL hydrolase family protein [Solirubrobacteraceae bacterium]